MGRGYTSKQEQRNGPAWRPVKFKEQQLKFVTTDGFKEKVKGEGVMAKCIWCEKDGVGSMVLTSTDGAVETFPLCERHVGVVKSWMRFRDKQRAKKAEKREAKKAAREALKQQAKQMVIDARLKAKEMLKAKAVTPTAAA